jgi:eukaryotic-like serine/threonine-protein kinase
MNEVDRLSPITSQVISNCSTDALNSRYQMIDVLGQGGVGITYRAKDSSNNKIVAIKALSLRKAKDWKAIELFEREAKVLAALDHPAIPSYIDYFQVDSEQDKQFYIVQSLAPGDSLANLVEKGWAPTLDEVKDIATQVLEILSYLHTLVPAVIHRDIKPQNLIRSKDGHISLVDFGAVQDTYHHTVTGGSTVVGTYGYMAPEQFRGQAYFSTDLYGLGATILYLLTRKDPGTLPQKNLKIDFWTYVSVPPKFSLWLDRLIEPEVLQRFDTADRALAVLTGQQNLPDLAKHKPINSRIHLTKSTENLHIRIPAVGLGNARSKQFSTLVLIWNILSLYVLFQFFANSFVTDFLKQLMFAMYGMVGIYLSMQWYYGIMSHATVNIQGKIITFTKFSANNKYWRKDCQLPYDHWQQHILLLHPPIYSYKKQIAQFITVAEHKWLLSEINVFLDRSTQHLDRSNPL